MSELFSPEHGRERASVATGEELAALLHHPAVDVLLALLDNPVLSEPQLCLLLARKDLPGEVLEEVSRRKPLLKTYPVKRALAFHPRAPRLVSLRMLRELYLMDLVQLTLLPGISAELKRNAEEQLLSRLPQLPLGQKITLARRGPARVTGSLLAEGHARIISVALENSFLTEAQVLKVSLLGVACVMFVYLMAPSPIWLFLIAPISSTFNGLSLANMGGLLSRSVPPQVQGEILGIGSSIQALANSFPPLLGGFFAASFAPEAPVVAAGLTMLMAWVVFASMYRPGTRSTLRSRPSFIPSRRAERLRRTE